MGQRGLEQLLGMDGKVEVERLAYVEAERCWRTTKCTLQCLFSLAFFQALFTHKCVYTGKTGSLKSGCARYCNATVKVSGGAGALIPASRAHADTSSTGQRRGYPLGPQGLCSHRLPVGPGPRLPAGEVKGRSSLWQPGHTLPCTHPSRGALWLFTWSPYSQCPPRSPPSASDLSLTSFPPQSVGTHCPFPTSECSSRFSWGSVILQVST